MRNQATCHPEEVAHSFGMCRRCYMKIYNKQKYQQDRDKELARVKAYQANDGYSERRRELYLENLIRERAKQRKYHRENREARNAAHKEWIRKNKVKQRHAMWKREYGLDVETIRLALVEQQGLCAICKTNIIGSDTKGKLLLAVDHDHSTGAFRGLLCSKCNKGLGLFGDNEEGVAAALAYLQRASRS